MFGNDECLAITETTLSLKHQYGFANSAKRCRVRGRISDNVCERVESTEAANMRIAYGVYVASSFWASH